MLMSLVLFIHTRERPPQTPSCQMALGLRAVSPADSEGQMTHSCLHPTFLSAEGQKIRGKPACFPQKGRQSVF